MTMAMPIPVTCPDSIDTDGDVIYIVSEIDQNQKITRMIGAYTNKLVAIAEAQAGIKELKKVKSDADVNIQEIELLAS